MPTRVWWGVTNPFKAQRSQVCPPADQAMLYFTVLLQLQSWLQGLSSHPNIPPASPFQLSADGGTGNLELKLALNTVLWWSRQELSGLPVALSSHHAQHQKSNTIQLCRRNVSSRCAVCRLQPWLPSLLLPPQRGVIMAPGPTGFLGWHQKSDSCNELLTRHIKLAPVSVLCQQLIEAPSREPCAEEFSATKTVYVWKTMTTPGSIMCAV